MTDDIVTRLRDMANSVIEKTDPRFQWLVDGADEIERLHKDRDRWIQCAERLVESQVEALEFYRDCQNRAREQVMRGGTV